MNTAKPPEQRSGSRLSPAAQRWVDEHLAQAPPLSSEQRDQLRALLSRHPAL
jgi:hypothetical protein